MILLIDNYDSFVHNLARHFQRLGCETLVLRNDVVDVATIYQLAPAAIVISPGPCTPGDAGRSLDMTRALHKEFPMLGVCLGHQVIAEGLGGRVARSAEPMHGRTSIVRHHQGRLFSEVPSPLRVCRYHSLVADENALPQVLVPTAWTAEGVLMAFEHVDLPVFGVQFHPEAILTEHGYRILANFLRQCGIEPAMSADRLASSERFTPPPEAALPTGPVTF